MKIGYDEIENVIWQVAREMNVKVNKKFTRKSAQLIHALFEETDMNNDIEVTFLARGGTQAQLSIWRRLSDALGFMGKLDQEAGKVYDWIAEQEANGRKLERFAEWAKSSERIQYIRMYRKDATNIRIDWPRAFEDGSSRMLASDEGI